MGIGKIPIPSDGFPNNPNFVPYYMVSNLQILIGGSMQDLHNNDLFQCLKVRSPIPWVYGVFYTVYYWMILTAIL